MRSRIAPLGAAAVFAAGACTSQPDVTIDPPVEWIPASAQLASYDSCEEALEGIQQSALSTMTAMRHSRSWGVDRLEAAQEDGAVSAESDEAAGAGDASSTAHSETNNAVAGVDEPDIVKTDGQYVYTATETVVRVVDADAAAVVAEHEYGWESWGHRLFLGDDELLVMYSRDRADGQEYRTEFVLERLDPRTLERHDVFTAEGSMLDARMVDGEVRLAVTSAPHLQPLWEEFYDGDAASLRRAVRQTEIDDWLPGFDVNGSAVETDCGDIAHPDRFEGGSTVSVLALPVDGAWTDVDPTTVIADGGTVHGTRDSLYLAHNDYHWGAEDAEAETELYRFVFDGGRARLAGEAAVPGTLLNQYSLSEHDGHLRAATTENNDFGWGIPEDTRPADEAVPSKSTVTVLRIGEDSLTEVGSVTDLGPDERIYSVRFIGDTGYVVTFRQTDPLYTVDLSDPRSPVVTGELKITGYSAYLHPVGDGRLLGVGQEATDQGVTTGLQVSLFDVTGDEASVLDQYERGGASSEAEWDPHGFLYWEPERIAVLPVWDWTGYDAETGAVVLNIGDDSVSELAWIAHGQDGGEEPYRAMITRSLVIGDQLWTLSQAGLMASELGGDYETAEWIGW
ncbi:beta-propeller domain-containing protein [Glycomyces halotolerans]